MICPTKMLRVSWTNSKIPKEKFKKAEKLVADTTVLSHCDQEMSMVMQRDASNIQPLTGGPA